MKDKLEHWNNTAVTFTREIKIVNRYFVYFIFELLLSHLSDMT
jgi:hypothetical protein